MKTVDLLRTNRWLMASLIFAMCCLLVYAFAMLTRNADIKINTVKKYQLIFVEATGQSMFIKDNQLSNTLPITFDKLHSNQEALNALFALDSDVLYPNSTTITLRGYISHKEIFDDQVNGEFTLHTFVLVHWYLPKPFCQYQNLPSDVSTNSKIEVNKTELTINSFSQNFIRKYPAFNPEFYVAPTTD